MSREEKKLFVGLAVCVAIVMAAVTVSSISLSVTYAELCWSNPLDARCGASAPDTLQQAIWQGAIPVMVAAIMAIPTAIWLSVVTGRKEDEAR